MVTAQLCKANFPGEEAYRPSVVRFIKNLKSIAHPYL